MVGVILSRGMIGRAGAGDGAGVGAGRPKEMGGTGPDAVVLGGGGGGSSVSLSTHAKNATERTMQMAPPFFRAASLVLPICYASGILNVQSLWVEDVAGMKFSGFSNLGGGEKKVRPLLLFMWWIAPVV